MIRLIDVTQQDMDKGMQCIQNKCAIALALRREYKTDNVSITMDEGYASLNVNGKELNIRDENNVSDFIHNYDNMGDDDEYFIEPYPFTLEVVE